MRRAISLAVASLFFWFSVNSYAAKNDYHSQTNYGNNYYQNWDQYKLQNRINYKPSESTEHNWVERIGYNAANVIQQVNVKITQSQTPKQNQAVNSPSWRVSQPIKTDVKSTAINSQISSASALDTPQAKDSKAISTKPAALKDTAGIKPALSTSEVGFDTSEVAKQGQLPTVYEPIKRKIYLDNNPDYQFAGQGKIFSAATIADKYEYVNKDTGAKVMAIIHPWEHEQLANTQGKLAEVQAQELGTPGAGFDSPGVAKQGQQLAQMGNIDIISPAQVRRIDPGIMPAERWLSPGARQQVKLIQPLTDLEKKDIKFKASTVGRAFESVKAAAATAKDWIVPDFNDPDSVGAEFWRSVSSDLFEKGFSATLDANFEFLAELSADNCGKWVEANIESKSGQVAAGYGYGLAEGISSVFIKDLPMLLASLPGLTKEATANPMAVTKALFKAVGLEFKQVAGRLEQALDDAGNFGGGRLIGREVGRLIGYVLAAKTGGKAVKELSESAAGQVLINGLTKSKPVQAIAQSITKVSNTKTAQAVKAGIDKVNQSRPMRTAQATKEFLNTKVTAKTAVNDLKAGAGNIKQAWRGSYEVNQGPLHMRGVRIDGGRKLDTTIKEAAAARSDGLLTKRELANVQKWTDKINGRGGKVELSAASQKIIFDSYINVAANGGKFVFDSTMLDPQAKQVFKEYSSPDSLYVHETRRFARHLSRMNEGQLVEFMDREHTLGRCSRNPESYTFTRNGESVTQQMIKYEYPDGKMVRYKPLGDERRVGSTYSLEIKKNKFLSDEGFESVAFKLDHRGNAFPKGPNEIRNPFPRGSDEWKKYRDFIMSKVHHELQK